MFSISFYRSLCILGAPVGKPSWEEAAEDRAGSFLARLQLPCLPGDKLGILGTTSFQVHSRFCDRAKLEGQN